MTSHTAFQRLAAVSRKSVVRYAVIGLLSLVLLYGLFGYFVLPGIIQSQARQFVAGQLHRSLTVDKVEINPFTLLAKVQGVKLTEPQGEAVFFAFDRLTVKVSPQSLFRLAPVVQEVLLNKPTVHLIRIDAHHYNFDDILAWIASQPQEQQKRPARFSAYNIQLENGRIEFEDRPAGATHVVSELTLGVPFISSLPSQVEIFVEPLLRANFNGAQLQLVGKARPFAAPKEATLELNLDDIDLTRYLEYLPFEPSFKLPSARLDLHLSASFQQSKNQAPALMLSGAAALKSLRIAELSGKTVLAVPALDVTLGKSDIFGDRLTITRVLLSGMVAELSRDGEGELNLSRLLRPGKTRETAATPGAKVTGASTAAPEPKVVAASTPLHVALDEFEIRDATVHYTDGQSVQPVHANLEKFDLTVRHAALDTGKHAVTVGEVASDSANFLLNQGKRPVPAESSGAAAPPPPRAHAASKNQVASRKSSGAEDGNRYTVNIGKVAIDHWSARLEDHSLKQTVVTRFEPLSMTAQNLSTAGAALAQLELKATVNGNGALAINGKLGFNPLHADLALDLKGVDILSLQPYITDQVNLLLTGANLSAKGALKLDQTGGNAWTGSFRGDLTLGNVATVDKVSADDFLRWKSLFLGGVDLRLAPFAVAIDQIALSDFFARVIVDPSGHINLQDVVRSNPDDGKSLTTSTGNGRTTAAASAHAQITASASPAEATRHTTPVKIRKLTLQGGKVRYTDNFIKPHYTANLMNLGGLVTGLSSEPSSRASVDLHGQVNDAPLTIAGTINPLKGDLTLDIKANVHGMELAPLSPYSGRYIGYGIEKGKLSFEVAYQIEQRKLSAQNRLILDQLTFGDKIESPVATKLPVLFAVSLLRDRNGVIDIHLPVSGSLDDPDFSVGGIIVKVILNVITKAVTEPFVLLGSLFGGGEEMSSLAFDPGRHAITPTGEIKLKALASALTERPALTLDITGWSAPDSDRIGLQHEAIDRKMRMLKVKDRGAHDAPLSTGSIVVTADEYPALLKRAYQAEKFPKPRNVVGIAKDLSVAEMEKLMLANTPIGDDDLIALGNQRAQAAKDWLLTDGKVPAERMFILSSKSGNGDANSKGKSAASGRVDFSLR